MYQNIYCRRKGGSINVHLWDDKRGYSNFIVKNYAYVRSNTGVYRSLYNDKLKKTSYWAEEDKKDVFESDIPLETKILIDRYSDSDEVSIGHRELFFDIEVDSAGGFPEWREADREIISIALYDKVTKQYWAFAKSQKMKGYIRDNTTVEVFESEEELLQRFFQKYLEINPTILSGWNIDGFDIPYLFNRTVKVLGHEFARSLSPIGNVWYNERIDRYKIAGVSVLDYLALYKRFTFKQQPSYRLDYIGKIEVGVEKISYDGSLDDLYKQDINKFVEYNLRDVDIIVKLDKKLDFISLARGVCHLGHVQYDDVFFPSRYIEGAMLLYMKKLNVIAPNKVLRGAKYKQIKAEYEKYSGAYVKDPVLGKHSWVYDLDLTSMYPSIIMSLNISPEMKVGKLSGWDAEEFFNENNKKTYTFKPTNKKDTTYSEIELKNIFQNKNITVSANGVMYRNDKKGLIPSILKSWFNQRKEYRRLAKKYAEENNDEQYEYFNRRQYIQKVMLNTVYGVLGLPIFRFYDRDNAEATTLTGQQLIKFSQKMTNYLYNKELNDNNDYVLYTDTDSLFVSAVPVIKKRYLDVDLKDEKDMTEKVLNVASDVQNFLNKSYDSFAQKFLNIKDKHLFNIKQEVIAKSVLLLAKKRYGQWIINENGQVCNKLDIKGLDIIRSSTPPAFRIIMKQILKDILTDVDKDIIDKNIIEFKNALEKLPIIDIVNATGMKGIEKYTDEEKGIEKHTDGKANKEFMFTNLKKGAPVHVKASIRYNDLLKYFNVDKKYDLIRSKDKIRWVYLKQNPLNIDAIAFKGYDDPEEIINFINTYIDYSKIFKHGLEKKLKMFYNALDWQAPIDSQVSIERFFK